MLQALSFTELINGQLLVGSLRLHAAALVGMFETCKKGLLMRHNGTSIHKRHNTAQLRIQIRIEFEVELTNNIYTNTIIIVWLNKIP